MMTNLLRRLEKIEASMAPPETMKVRVTIRFIGADGRPTGEIKFPPEKDEPER